MKRIPSKSEKVFYNENFRQAACQWIEGMPRENERPHTSRSMWSRGKASYARSTDTSQLPRLSTSLTVASANLCRLNRTTRDKKRYLAAKGKEKVIKDLGYNLVTAWECEKPPRAKRYSRKELRAYPHYIVFDFEALLHVMNQKQTDDILYESKHIPVSVAIHDSLSKSPTFIEHVDPRCLFSFL